MWTEQHNMRVPSELVPRCPVCGSPMTMNLSADDTFLQDEGWYQAQGRYQAFLRRHEGLRTVFLELGVGCNTPGIIKYPFWKMAARNRKASYICINNSQMAIPTEILKCSLCIEADVGETLAAL